MAVDHRGLPDKYPALAKGMRKVLKESGLTVLVVAVVVEVDGLCGGVLGPEDLSRRERSIVFEALARVLKGYAEQGPAH